MAHSTSDVLPASSGYFKQPSAWRTCEQSSCSLKDVMSETLAEELLLRDSTDHDGNCEADSCDSSWLTCDSIDTSSDYLIAQMLQNEFNSEHNLQLKIEENKLNGSNKVKVTFDNYKAICEDSSPESDSDCQNFSDHPAKEVGQQFGRRGFRGKGTNIITKHDSVLCGRMNALKFMESFPPEFDTGDSGSSDISLSNVVFNQLMAHSRVENKRSQRLHEKKEHSTAELAVDSKTRLLLYKLVNAGILDAVNGIVSCGKESVVFHATGGSRPNEVIPSECAVKIFKTSLSKFQNRYQYVRGDVRFFKDEFKRHNPRKIMRIWAEKEMINLKRMQKFGIPCPSVVILKKHILVLSFIGSSQSAAPKLKDAVLSESEWHLAYEQCIQHMRTLYKDCLLVHADLSEYNILWWQDRIYIIDVAQAVDLMHPLAVQFLLRDCENISEFFKKQGVAGVHDKFKLFSAITDMDLNEKELQSQIEQYEKDERLLQLEMSKTEYPFDYFFNKTCLEREAEKTEQESSISNTEAVVVAGSID